MSDWVKREDIQQPEATFNIDAIQLTNKLIDAHQEGNFIVGTTEHGVRFRQHIPASKLLNKVDGRFVLQERVVTG